MHLILQLVCSNAIKLRRAATVQSLYPIELYRVVLCTMLSVYTCVHTYTTLFQPQQEVLMTELNLVTSDIDLALSNLSSWMSPDYVHKDLLNKFNSAYIVPEPYGVVLIISPWNFPLMLSLQPLVGAIAAGKRFTLQQTAINTVF